MATDEIARQRRLAPEATLGVTTDGDDAATTARVNCLGKKKTKKRDTQEFIIIITWSKHSSRNPRWYISQMGGRGGSL